MIRERIGSLILLAALAEACTTPKSQADDAVRQAAELARTDDPKKWAEADRLLADAFKKDPGNPGVKAVQEKLSEKRSASQNTNTAFLTKTDPAPPAVAIMPGEVERLTIAAKGKPQTVINRAGAEWSLQDGRKANATEVVSLLEALSKFALKDRIAKGVTNFAAYDLTPEQAVHVIVTSKGKTALDIWIGATKARGQMVRLGTDEQVWSATGISAWQFDKTADQIATK